MSGVMHGPAPETWVIVTDIHDDAGTVRSTHPGEHGYDDAMLELEHPDELWQRFDAPAVGERIDRGIRRRR